MATKKTGKGSGKKPPQQPKQEANVTALPDLGDRAARVAARRDAILERARVETISPKGGRPSNYSRELCEAIIEHGKQGLSMSSFAAQVEVSRQQLYLWRETHAEFRDAWDRAMAHRQLLLEKEILSLRDAGPISVRLRLLANIAADDWRERTEVGLGGVSDAPAIKTAMSVEDATAKLMAIRGTPKAA